MKILAILTQTKLPQGKKTYQCKTFIMLNSKVVLNLRSSTFMKGIAFKDDRHLMHQAVNA